MRTAIFIVLCVITLSCSEEPEFIIPTIQIGSSKYNNIAIGEVVTIRVNYYTTKKQFINKISSDIDIYDGAGFLPWKLFNGNTTPDSLMIAAKSERIIHYKMTNRFIKIRFRVVDDEQASTSKTIELKSI
jgi:hypothetical protein